ncbi:prepilin-type N-terminal cleavage/methylation domain-containing protein [Rhodoplanes sp. TEM]|uniref:Prepilin-type N-terminal cleavage/methylation domain-containing protein n=1 Tax=Rhodoplanes tepidamans TaxID=200616 RepID=A0ABT5JC75_RHOTP|nr:MULTISPECIES: prepilin-type N-terminal cleavage/methylation domain-containing protein [Rhodoplanes]MDC7787291.1 prepilin-type N-terminal cleavage/methylation domain-containing protein [Rhodoplanes tepidamans]MDC7985319.1 prepilin-type N-terminal cleavage/methylation domain-containing protein [Rhodoplanes sp. TEM]MDQ0357826.1 general secretion pathway protein J [Rhodoplanes tepidamans]
MSRTASVSRAAEAGFTLVEALVATVLMGVVLGALATVTAQWLPGWNRGLVRVQRAEQVALAMDRVVADLAAAEMVPRDRESKAPLFEGTALAVTVVRTALGPNARPGLEIVRIAAAGHGLALARSAAPYLPRDPEDLPPRFFDAVPLLGAPYRVSFSYAGRDGVWQAEWIDMKELPRAVRVVVRDGTSGRALAASTVAPIRAELRAECVVETTAEGCGPRPAAPAAATTDTGVPTR